MTGNTNGILIFSGAVGNLVRRNFAVGNPPIQVSVDHPATSGADIRDLAAPGSNTYDSNVCVSGVNVDCPNVDARSMRLPG